MSGIQPIAVPQTIDTALRNASKATGVDFDYLLKTAVRESGLDSDAKSKTSSATGLFQFIEQTWLGMIKSVGPQMGMGDIAAQIETTPDGRHKVTEGADRSAILALRKDPGVAAMVAGAYTRVSHDTLSENIGRQPTEGELYIAHFLGAGGAVRLISEAETNPDRAGRDLFPDAARANRSIFYEASGRPRSVAGVYDVLVRKHGDSPVRIADAPTRPPEDARDIRISPAAAEYLRPVNFGADGVPAGGLAVRSLFSDTGGSRSTGHAAGEDAYLRDGPLVLSSAQIRIFYEKTGAIDASGSPVDNVGRRATEETPAPPISRARGLLAPRKPLYDLFRTN